MGSFNVSCGVSMMSIDEGDRCVLIPLTKTKYSDSISEGAYYISNDGPIGRFHPITLPIFGEYNSYGMLENIEEDSNTKAIEKFYGCPIVDFVQHMCSHHHSDIKDNDKVPKNPFGMFVKREVYDEFTKNPMNEWGGGENCFKDSDLCPFVLKYLGFVEDTTVERNSTERYNRPFKHEKIPNLIAFSDGTWNRFQVDDNVEMHPYIYHPDDLMKFLIDNKMYVMVDRFNDLRKLRLGEMEYDKDCENLIKRIETDKEMELMQEKLTNSNDLDARKTLAIAHAMARMSDDLRHQEFLTFGNWASNNKHFRELYCDLLKDSEFRSQMINYKTFESQLWHVNTPLMPSWAGLQCGNHNAELRLSKLIQKLCKQSINKHKDCYWREWVSDWFTEKLDKIKTELEFSTIWNKIKS